MIYNAVFSCIFIGTLCYFVYIVVGFRTTGSIGRTQWKDTFCVLGPMLEFQFRYFVHMRPFTVTRHLSFFSADYWWSESNVGLSGFSDPASDVHSHHINISTSYDCDATHTSQFPFVPHVVGGTWPDGTDTTWYSGCYQGRGQAVDHLERTIVSLWHTRSSGLFPRTSCHLDDLCATTGIDMGI